MQPGWAELWRNFIYKKYIMRKPNAVAPIRNPHIVSPVTISLYPWFHANNSTPNQVTTTNTKITLSCVIAEI